MIFARVLAIIGVISHLAWCVHGDSYMLMPRGSNDRLNEPGRDRNNGNRLFDSQNNNRGGYNVGSMYYYVGTIVPVEWTVQHSCGDPGRANCEITLQYTCDDRLRDGSTTDTIPTNRNNCYNFNCDTDVRYGRHESYASYYNCRQRSRNLGLFTANQNLGGNTGAIRTRQNPNADRHGYECPEERDYYPYWAPTMWRDVAIFTNQASRCAAYQAESQNVKAKSYCVPQDSILNAKWEQEGWIPIDQPTCAKLNYTWTTVPAWGSSPPVCYEHPWSRDNHHGNVKNGFPASFNWTIPGDILHEHCALRLRYNISTLDMQYWASDTSVAPSGLNASLNSVHKNNNVDPALVPIWQTFGFNISDVPEITAETARNGNVQTAETNSRQYVLRNNPQVDPFGSLVPKNTIRMQLAINTAQYGRTFQDRSFRFAIRPRPSTIPASANIHLLSVRGKRGNIVQVYPCVEYDFHPNRLELGTNDYVHIQWTGSNTNDPNNAGEGEAGTDRSNMVQLREKSFDDLQPGGGTTPQTTPTTFGSYSNYYPANIQNTSFLGLPYTDLQSLAILSNMQFGGSMSLLDDAGTYFDLGVRQISAQGIYHYLCTRNNNFSNRNQVGMIKVSTTSTITTVAGSQGAVVSNSGASVTIPQGSLQGYTNVQFAVVDGSAAGSVADHGSVCSLNLDTTPATPVTIQCPYSAPTLLVKNSVSFSQSINGPWTSQSASMSNNVATIQTTQSGYYATSSTPDNGAIAGIVVGVVIFVGIMIGLCVYCHRKRQQAAGNTATMRTG